MTGSVFATNLIAVNRLLNEYYDSIAVIAVDLGLILATWQYSHLKPHTIPRGDIPFDYAKLGLFGSVARVIIGKRYSE
jgi:hypothetical protein